MVFWYVTYVMGRFLKQISDLQCKRFSSSGGTGLSLKKKIAKQSLGNGLLVYNFVRGNDF